MVWVSEGLEYWYLLWTKKWSRRQAHGPVAATSGDILKEYFNVFCLVLNTHFNFINMGIVFA